MNYIMENLFKQCIEKKDFEKLKSIIPYIIVREDSLHDIIYKKCIEEMKIILLISSPKVIEYKDNEHRTPLHVATQLGEIKMVQLLLSKNARIRTIDNFGRTPVFTALKHNFFEIAIMILKKGENFTGTKNDDYIKYYRFCIGLLTVGNKYIKSFLEMQEEFDVDFKDLENIDTPLMLAILNRQYYEVISLINAGADVNYRRKGKGYFAIHIAVQQENCDMLDCLLTYNADVNCIYLAPKNRSHHYI